MEEEKLEEINNPNEIVEIDANEEISNTQYDITGLNEVVKDNKNKKKKKKNRLTKKQIIIIWSCVVILLLITTGLLLYFLVFRKNENKPVSKEPVVIIEKDNYIYKDGVLTFIDEEKKELGTYECQNKNEKLCYIAYYDNGDDDFDSAKKVYEDGRIVDVKSDIINKRYVFIYDDTKKEDGKIILYDLKDNKKIDTYDLVKEGLKDTYIVKKEEQYGLLSLEDDKLEEKITFKYEYIGYIEGTKYLIVATNGNYKLINSDDKDMSKTVPGYIKNYGDSGISVKVGSDYYLYNYDGKKIVDDTYDYLSFVDDYIIIINGRKLNIIDNMGNKMNGEAIRLSGTDYNTKLIFNEDLRQIGKEELYSTYINGNTLKIELEDETVNVNLNEGLFNKNLSYVSYFAGKLYFYSDEQKSNLIGSYKCNYANAINEGTSSLDNCFIAKESNLFKSSDETIINSYIPIYNERYVFIADTKAPKTNDNIVLYDLKNNKQLATYKLIDLGYHTENSGVSFIDTAGTIGLAYSIKNSSYGLINILNSNIDTVIPFKDENNLTNVEFKMVGDNISFKKSDNNNYLYTMKGEELTKNVKTTDEIIEYKSGIVKIKTANNTYMIYNASDGKLLSSECTYLEMEDKFYVAVDTNNNLGIYKYIDNVNLLPDVVIDAQTEVKYTISGKSVVISYTVAGVPSSQTITIEE